MANSSSPTEQLRLSHALLGAALLISTATGSSSPASSADKITSKTINGVVELFTSQGCSSCPPADALLSDYAKRDDVLALSFHVDYWNYLGWKDTFSHARFTERQQRYAISFNRRGVYTPQAVINGRTHVVGSYSGQIEGLMADFKKSGKGLNTPLNVAREADALRITASLTPNAQDSSATLWIISYSQAENVKIKRGENSGRIITYHNVVRDISMVAMTKDGKLDISLPTSVLNRSSADGFALLLQQTTKSGTPGPIIGAAQIEGGSS